jgi:hypothetical protein
MRVSGPNYNVFLFADCRYFLLQLELGRSVVHNTSNYQVVKAKLYIHLANKTTIFMWISASWEVHIRHVDVGANPWGVGAGIGVTIRQSTTSAIPLASFACHQRTQWCWQRCCHQGFSSRLCFAICLLWNILLPILGSIYGATHTVETWLLSFIELPVEIWILHVNFWHNFSKFMSSGFMVSTKLMAAS